MATSEGRPSAHRSHAVPPAAPIAISAFVINAAISVVRSTIFAGGVIEAACL